MLEPKPTIYNGPAAESRIDEEGGGEKTMTEPRMLPRRSPRWKNVCPSADVEQRVWNWHGTAKRKEEGRGEKWTD